MTLKFSGSTKVTSALTGRRPLHPAVDDDLKREFFDAVLLRYGWELKHLPHKCGCRAK